MKLQHFLIADQLAEGDGRGACNAILLHFGQGELPPSAQIRVNSSMVADADHIIIYTPGHWYEWGERSGFRHAPFDNYQDSHRATIWSRRFQ